MYIITYTNDLEELFPGNEFIKDEELVIYFQLCFIFKLVLWVQYESSYLLVLYPNLVVNLFFTRCRLGNALVCFFVIFLHCNTIFQLCDDDDDDDDDDELFLWYGWPTKGL